MFHNLHYEYERNNYHFLSINYALLEILDHCCLQIMKAFFTLKKRVHTTNIFHEVDEFKTEIFKHVIFDL